MTADSRPQPLDSVRAASVRYRIAIGPHSGNRTLTLHDPSCIKTDKSPKPLTVDSYGFSLNAAVSCKPYQRERLERLCRYITRQAICLDRLNVKNPFRNGATHILFSPLDFLGKLAALIPRPRHHLVRYHGIFAPNARIRKRIVPTKGKKTKTRKKSDKGEYKAIPGSNSGVGVKCRSKTSRFCRNVAFYSGTLLRPH